MPLKRSLWPSLGKPAPHWFCWGRLGLLLTLTWKSSAMTWWRTKSVDSVSLLRCTQKPCFSINHKLLVSHFFLEDDFCLTSESYQRPWEHTHTQVAQICYEYLLNTSWIIGSCQEVSGSLEYMPSPPSSKPLGSFTLSHLSYAHYNFFHNFLIIFLHAPFSFFPSKSNRIAWEQQKRILKVHLHA